MWLAGLCIAILLFPGLIICLLTLMQMRRTGIEPILIIRGEVLPAPVAWLVLLVGGWFWALQPILAPIAARRRRRVAPREQTDDQRFQPVKPGAN